MPFSKNLTILVGKLESSAGTAEFNLTSTFPADADFDCRVVGIEHSPDIEMDDANGEVMTGDHRKFASYAGARKGEITLEIACEWGGAVDTAPSWSKFLQACGLYENAYTTTGIGYQPLTVMDATTMTIAVFEVPAAGGTNSIGYLYKGCCGNAKLVAETSAGKLKWQITMTGAFVGAYEVVTATEVPDLTGAPTILAEKLLGATCSIHGVSQHISGFELDLGNAVSAVPDQSDATGYSHFYITNRDPRLAINATKQEIATEDIYTSVAAETTGVITIATTNLNIYLPRTQFLPPSMGDADGLLQWDHAIKPLGNSLGVSPVESDIPDEATFEVYQGTRS